MVKSILFGGRAGQGPNILTALIAEALVSKGYYVFYSRDYQSLIRGGHNFNVLSFSSKPISSNESKVDLIVALAENTVNLHKKDLKAGGVILKGEHDNMYFAGAMFRVLGIEFDILEERLRKLKKFEENLEHAKQGYNEEKREIKINSSKFKTKFDFLNGSQAVCNGAIKSGLEVYYAYPMTPATPLLFELAPKQAENNFVCIELENEIAVAMASLGSAATGAKTMMGTSGGGFDLMTEAFSMAGMAEIPFVAYLAMRPGPGTGVATYTGQGDLNLVRHGGHGEFFRLVVAPGDCVECEELTSQVFYFSQKYKIPALLLSDKHLAESFYTSSERARITKSQKSVVLKRFNSYEHNSAGEATENSSIISKEVERRNKKTKDVEKEAEKFEMFKIYGKKDSKNLVVSYGSTKGAILDSIKDLDCKFMQILYIEPFSKKIEAELGKAKKIILVENSATGMLGDLIREKTGIKIEDKNKILRYDGRPFNYDLLREDIRRRL